MKKLPAGYTKFDVMDYLRTEEDMMAFLNIAFESGDSGHIADALGIVAKARGMTRIAKKAGLTRAALYQSLSKNGNPGLDTLLKVMNALGFRLQAA